MEAGGLEIRPQCHRCRSLDGFQAVVGPWRSGPPRSRPARTDKAGEPSAGTTDRCRAHHLAHDLRDAPAAAGEADLQARVWPLILRAVANGGMPTASSGVIVLPRRVVSSRGDNWEVGGHILHPEDVGIEAATF